MTWLDQMGRNDQAMQLALPMKALSGLKVRFQLPPVVPPFSKRNRRLFSILWVGAFLLAIFGPDRGSVYPLLCPRK